MSSQQASSSTSVKSVRSTYPRCEIRSVINQAPHFAPRVRGRDQSSACEKTYGSEVMSHQYVHERVKSFKEGHADTQSGRLWHLSFGTKKAVLLVDLDRTSEMTRKSQRKI
ncbi:hypothetical protein AAG570_013033 [Ranatra chinensis]|uniref:Uncharacterized protein n=1 Tax=Ranatra chinensis TaxID=642074 RepID=A0ABD0Z3V8_9HEMI